MEHSREAVSTQQEGEEENITNMLFLICLSVIGGFLIFLYLISPIISPKRLDLDRAHVVITGGSSGIGKELAAEALKKGSSVTLIARNKNRLQEAKSAIEVFIKHKGVQKIHCISVDLSSSYENVHNAIKQAEETLGPIHMLVNCAGTSMSCAFENTPIDEFQRMMQINYLGSVFPTRAVIDSMKSHSFGRIVFVSSAAGQLGVYGYSAYSASKYALRGLAEALQMELKPFNIHITLAFPPDTDTPGYAEEQKAKPQETHLISETAGLFQPDYVAKAILADAVQGKFMSFMGVDGYMLSTLTCGMSPVNSIMEATQQVILMGFFRAVSLFYLDSFDRIVKKCKAERENQVQPPSSTS